MSDRELLELAAKAAGVAGEYCEFTKHPEGTRVYGFGDPFNFTWGEYLWNPLTDDGDALRLAVRLCFSIEQSTSVIEVTIGKELIYRFVALEKANRLEATRRAIVRAAAEIGKEMK